MAATSVFHTPHLGQPPINFTGAQSTAAGRSTPGPWLGDIHRNQDLSAGYGTGEFIYLAGVAGTVRGSWVVFNPDDFGTSLLSTGQTTPGVVAVAMSPNVAGQYGWYQISGKAIGLAAGGFADNGLVYATATPGTVSSTVAAGFRVLKALGASAVGVPGAGLAEFEIDRPSITAGAAN
jgi:hypothetical protein